MSTNSFSHLGSVNSQWRDVLEKLKAQEQTQDTQQENLLEIPNRIEDELYDGFLQTYNIKRDGMSRQERLAYERMLDKMKRKGGRR